MKVKEIIEEFKKFPDDYEVYAYDVAGENTDSFEISEAVLKEGGYEVEPIEYFEEDEDMSKYKKGYVLIWEQS